MIIEKSMLQGLQAWDEFTLFSPTLTHRVYVERRALVQVKSKDFVMSGVEEPEARRRNQH